MPATATLSSKFQISIPKAVREEQHWKAGQEFVFIPKGQGMLLMPVPELDQLEASPEVPAARATAIARTATDGGAGARGRQVSFETLDLWSKPAEVSFQPALRTIKS